MTRAVAISLKLPLPALIAIAGERAAYRFLEFFTAQIRIPNTRRAYARAVGDFMTWLEHADVASLYVAAYVEDTVINSGRRSLGA